MDTYRRPMAVKCQSRMSLGVRQIVRRMKTYAVAQINVLSVSEETLDAIALILVIGLTVWYSSIAFRQVH